VNVLKPNVIQRKSELKEYNILAIPYLSHDCEIWTLKQRQQRWDSSDAQQDTIY